MGWTRVLRFGLAVALATAAPLAVSSPASADIVSPAGACVGSLTWKAGGFTKTTQQLKSSDVIKIPRADQVSWTGSVVGPAAGTAREVSGRVALRLPAPLGSIAISNWGGQATEVKKSGSYSYDLPSIVPAGVVLDLIATHDEAGKRHCTAGVGVMIAGGPFDSPLTWVAPAGVLMLASVLALLGRSATRPGAGRVVAGGLLGLPFGLFLGLSLILLGLIPLASPLVTILVGLGAVAGALWTYWSPLSAGRPAP